MATTYDYLFKVLLVGETGVGKTSLLLRFSQDEFTDTFISTIGIDYRIRTIDLNGKIIKLQIWDTAGQEKFRCITPLYYREALGIMLVYDITNEKSFENLKGWIKNVEEHSSWYIKMMILGNKCDMNHRRQVSRVRGEQLAKEHGNRKFMEISAKANVNVEEAFITLARDILISGREFHHNRGAYRVNVSVTWHCFAIIIKKDPVILHIAPHKKEGGAHLLTKQQQQQPQASYCWCRTF